MKKQYYGQLDTIRLLAMIAIICYHYFTHTVTAGFLGVDLFLILSGILMADHLEKRYTKQMDGQWLIRLFRRIKKLIWPMLVIVVFCVVGLLLFRRELLVNIRPSVWSGLLFVSNWRQIIAGGSYFANFLHPDIFAHLWYIAVYLQLIIFMEAFYRFIRRFFKTPQAVGWFFMGLSIISGLLMALLFTPGQDPTRVYYGTDTRFFSFGLGVACYLIISPTIAAFRHDNRVHEERRKDGTVYAYYDYNNQEMGEPTADQSPKSVKSYFYAVLNKGFLTWIVDIIAEVAILICTFLMFNLTDSGTFTYYGGMFLFNIVAAIGLIALMQPNSWLGLLLQFPITANLGNQTFPVFLWYYPIFTIFYSSVPNGDGFTGMPWLQIAVIFVLGFATYQLLMQKRYTVPFFILEKGEPLRLFQEKEKLTAHTTPLPKKIIFGLLAIGFVTATGTVIAAPTDDTAQKETQKALEQQSKNAQLNSERAAVSQQSEPLTKVDQEAVNNYYQGLDQEQQYLLEFVSDDAKKHAYQFPVTFIGDSLTVGVSPAIYALYPQAIVSAQVGLQMYAVAPLIQSLAQQGALQENIVLNLGANGPFTESQFDQVDNALGANHKIYLVNTHVDRQWHDEVNQFLADKAKENPERFVLIDWDTYYKSQDHTTWLEPDGLHLNKEGSRHWIAFIGDELAKH